MSCSTISSARAFSLGVLVGNSEGDDVDDRVAGVLVDWFGAGVLSSSLSHSSMIAGVDYDVDVVLLMLGDGILVYLRLFLMTLR